jgi:hypothetical protein
LDNGLGPRVCGAFARLSKQFSTAVVDKSQLAARPRMGGRAGAPGVFPPMPGKAGCLWLISE